MAYYKPIVAYQSDWKNGANGNVSRLGCTSKYVTGRDLPGNFCFEGQPNQGILGRGPPHS